MSVFGRTQPKRAPTIPSWPAISVPEECRISNRNRAGIRRYWQPRETQTAKADFVSGLNPIWFTGNGITNSWFREPTNAPEYYQVCQAAAK